jgi:hypothetical protein
VAETRAVNRALRKAYGIGIRSVEEIGTSPSMGQKLPPQNANGNGNGAGPKVRDRLCQLIRQHKLDPELVKAYAVDFCGTKTLREATREQVERLRPANWPTGPRRTAMPCSASSTAISARKKVPHETPDHWFKRRGPLYRRPNPRRSLPRSGATSPFSSASAKALLNA